MFCTKCGTSNDDSASFCSKCGNTIVAAKSDAADTAPPVQKGSASSPPDASQPPKAEDALKNLKQGLSGLSSIAKNEAAKLATGAGKIAKNLKEEAQAINDIKNNTLQSNDGVASKQALAKSFLDQLSSKQKLLLGGVAVLLIGAVFFIFSGKSYEKDAKEAAAMYCEAMERVTKAQSRRMNMQDAMALLAKSTELNSRLAAKYNGTESDARGFAQAYLKAVGEGCKR